MRDFVNRALPVMVVMMMLVIIAMPANMAQAAQLDTTPKGAYVSINDTNIVIGYIDEPAQGYSDSTRVYGTQNERGTRTKMYYAFASNGVWLYSFDRTDWTAFTNNINEDCDLIFAGDAVWAAKGEAQGLDTGIYEVYGNLRTPDVIWNVNMDKWCMYMSVSGAGG